MRAALTSHGLFSTTGLAFPIIACFCGSAWPIFAKPRASVPCLVCLSVQHGIERPRSAFGCRQESPCGVHGLLRPAIGDEAELCSLCLSSEPTETSCPSQDIVSRFTTWREIASWQSAVLAVFAVFSSAGHRTGGYEIYPHHQRFLEQWQTTSVPPDAHAEPSAVQGAYVFSSCSWTLN